MARKKVQRNIAFDDIRNLYYVTFNYGYVDNQDLYSKKKQIKSTKTFKNKKDAQLALKIFEADKAKKVLPITKTLEEWLNYWFNDIKAINCEETTLYGYRNVVYNHLIPEVGKYKLQELTCEIINRYFTSKKRQGLSNNTIRKHYDLLKDALNIAVNEDIIVKNPMQKIKPIKVHRKEMNFYNVEQLKQLFSIVENDRMEVVVKLSGLCGLRREEIAGLRWHNVNFDNKTITIAEARTQAGKKTITKGTKNRSSYRILHAPDEIIEIFKKIKQNQIYKGTYKDNAYVVAWETGNPYRPNFLSDLFKKIIDEYSLPKLRLHDLRHTFASIANQLGVSLYEISKALGHSEVGTTSDIYTHRFEQVNKNAIFKVAEALSRERDD